MQPTNKLTISIVLMLIGIAILVSAKKTKVKKTDVELDGELPTTTCPDGTISEVKVRGSGMKPAKVKVKKMKTDRGSKYLAPEDSCFSTGMDEHNSLSCFKKGHPGDNDCDQACVAELEDADGEMKACFTKCKKALCFDHPSEDLTMDSYDPPSGAETTAEGARRRRRRRSIRQAPSRAQRSVQPGLVDTGFLKVLYFPDAAFMNLFLDFAEGNITAAREDVEQYIMLITNEETLIYQTLTNRSQITVDDVTRNLDLAVYVAGIQYPDDNGTTFEDPSWSQPDETGTLSTPLGSFRDFMVTYSTNTTFDQATALTGYDLGSAVGIAYLGQICNSQYNGYNVAIVQAYGAMAVLLGHEHGHGLGINHDDGGVECPKGTYVMSPYLTLSSVSTYSTLSNCSVDLITNYLNNLGSKYIENCVYDNQTHVTHEDFLTDFCEGTYHSQTFDEQCKIKMGDYSEACGLAVNETHVAKCSKGGIRCRNSNGKCRAKVNEVIDGTPCVPASGTEPHFCFDAECLPVKTWCDGN